MPDDCDVNPNDPDGNQLVSPDCNGDLMPDECESQGHVAASGESPSEFAGALLRPGPIDGDGDDDDAPSNDATQTAPTTTANPVENPLADARGSDHSPLGAENAPAADGIGGYVARSGNTFDEDAAWLEL